MIRGTQRDAEEGKDDSMNVAAQVDKEAREEEEEEEWSQTWRAASGFSAGGGFERLNQADKS